MEVESDDDDEDNFSNVEENDDDRDGMDDEYSDALEMELESDLDMDYSEEEEEDDEYVDAEDRNGNEHFNGMDVGENMQVDGEGQNVNDDFVDDLGEDENANQILVEQNAVGEVRYPVPRPRRNNRFRNNNNRQQIRHGRVGRNYRQRRNYGQRNRPRGDIRPRQRRIYRPQKYRFEWETHPDKQLWLRSCRDSEYHARCLLCGYRVQSYLHTIEDHARADIHTTNLANHQAAGSPPLVDEEVEHLNTHQFRTEQARIQLILTFFFAAAYLPFRLIDRLLPLTINIARFYNVLRSVSLSRTTMSNIVRRVIAPVFHDQLKQIIMNQRFSILFDESTDKSRKKHGCVTIRFFSETLKRTVSSVWKIFKIYSEDNEASNATAAALYNLIIETFGNVEDLARIRNNIISFMSDGAATMVGIRNSVASRFRDWCPGILTLICICHRIQLCSTDAFLELPLHIQTLARDIYNLFRSSAKQHTLSQHQINENMNVNELLRPVPERWLSTGPALRVIDENWDPIVMTLRDHNERVLLGRLEDPVTRCYVTFLNFIIPVLENMNGFFQSEETLLPELYSRVVEDIEDILLCFLNQEYYQRVGLAGVDLGDDENFLDLDELFIGDDARFLCELLPLVTRNDFLRTCLSYYVRLSWNLLQRLEVYWRPYQCTQALLEVNALSQQYHDQHPDAIRDMAALFPRLIEGASAEERERYIVTLENEWENLLGYPFVNFQHRTRTDGFWHQVKNITERDGERPFATIGTFCLDATTIPHSNAESERAWSRERLTKPRLRNKLHVETLDALMGAGSCVDLQDCRDDITNFEVNPEMIRRILAKEHNPPRANNNNNNDAGLAQVMEELILQMNPEQMQEGEEIEDERIRNEP